MLRLHPPALTPATERQLESLQRMVDGEATYPDQVARAKREWDRKTSSRAKRAAIQEVRDKLGAMSFGRRCHYCEDSCNDEIEHLRPKDLFPGSTFRWDNYVYACGPCNGPKGNKWGVIDARGDLIEINRHHTEPKTPPPPGIEALIDPRRENPLDALFLDIANNTFLFTPLPGLSATNTLRATFTIKLLRLNARPYLANMRRSAFAGYANAMVDYVTDSIRGPPHATSPSKP